MGRKRQAVLCLRSISRYLLIVAYGKLANYFFHSAIFHFKASPHYRAYPSLVEVSEVFDKYLFDEFQIHDHEHRISTIVETVSIKNSCVFRTGCTEVFPDVLES